MTNTHQHLPAGSGGGHRESRKRKILATHRSARRLRIFLYLSAHPRRMIIKEEESTLGQAMSILLEPELREAFSALRVGLVRDVGRNPYYPKFARFLRSNGISFEYVDIHLSTWAEAIERFDLIVWKPSPMPWDVEEAREKIWFAEYRLHKWIYPSLSEVMFYEDKAVQYDTLKHLGAPVINTFVTHDYDEARQWIAGARYPFVSKLKTGSASLDVVLVRSPLHARMIVEEAFRSGRPSSMISRRQKDYVLFQDFVENHGYDLRIEVINRDTVFGYYRTVRQGDFRASGFGDVVKAGLPQEALKIAVETAEKLDFTNISIDFLRSRIDNRYYIIEASNFIAVETDMQLMVDGRPGRYRYSAASDQYVFEEGRYWVQELILKNLFERRARNLTSPSLHWIRGSGTTPSTALQRSSGPQPPEGSPKL